jgi:hypothetical protein
MASGQEQHGNFGLEGHPQWDEIKNALRDAAEDYYVQEAEDQRPGETKNEYDSNTGITQTFIDVEASDHIRHSLAKAAGWNDQARLNAHLAQELEIHKFAEKLDLPYGGVDPETGEWPSVAEVTNPEEYYEW